MILQEGDIKKYVPLQTSTFDFDNYTGFETRALYKHLPRFLGQTLVDQLDRENPDAQLKAKVVPVLANLTVLESVSFLDVVLTSYGFGVVRNNNIAPASPERVQKFAEACATAANDFIDILLTWLEANTETYADWNKCSLNTGNLVVDCDVFNTQTKLNLKRHQFVDLMVHMNVLEYTVFKQKLSTEFLAELQAGSDAVVKPPLQQSLCFMSYFEFLPETDPQRNIWKRKADMLLQKAMSILVNNLETYVTYATNGYEAPYDNADEDNEGCGIFIAGPTA